MQTSEKRRNSILADLLFISGSHPLAALVYSFYDRYTHLQPPQRFEVTEEIDPTMRYYQIFDTVCYCMLRESAQH